MARKLRLEYPGAIYHVLNRGDRREAIFRSDQDRRLFLETLAQVCLKTGWQVHALCQEKLSGYRWSSYPAYLLPARRRPGWLRVDRLLGEHGLPVASKRARREFVRRMEARRAADLGREWKRVRRGWCLGGKDFRKELLAEMRGRTGPHHGGEERRESEEAWAAQLLAEGLKRQGWTVEDLARRRKGDGVKVRLARRLRQETTMTLSWIANNLNMGAAGSVANLLRKTI